jgi:Cu(I)/Ag(I) efflux system membrane fusion protein
VLAPQVAKQLLGYLKEVDVEVLDEPAKSYWSEQTRALASHLDKLNQAVKIEPQREQFSFVSNLLIEMIQVLGHGESTYYIQHCPMAFNDQGADWLSTEETIRNPYFGDKMLKCGILESVLN